MVKIFWRGFLTLAVFSNLIIESVFLIALPFLYSAIAGNLGIVCSSCWLLAVCCFLPRLQDQGKPDMVNVAVGAFNLAKIVVSRSISMDSHTVPWLARCSLWWQ